jgi:hypothetical protein
VIAPGLIWAHGDACLAAPVRVAGPPSMLRKSERRETGRKRGRTFRGCCSTEQRLTFAVSGGGHGPPGPSPAPRRIPTLRLQDESVFGRYRRERLIAWLVVRILGQGASPP